jgi:hypothetical protein
MVLFAVACSSAREPPMSAPHDRRPFSCEATPELFGMPGARIAWCGPVEPFGELLYAVNLISDERSLFGYYPVVGGYLFEDRGIAVFGRFLRQHGLLGRSDVPASAMILLASGLEGFPDPVATGKRADPQPGLEPSLSVEPFRFVVYGNVPVVDEPGAGFAPPADPEYVRATLAEGSGKLVWTLARGRVGGSWVDVDTIPGE